MNKKEIRFALNTVIAAAENSRCESLHHSKKHLHEIGEICKAEYAISRQAYILREYMKGQGL